MTATYQQPWNTDQVLRGWAAEQERGYALLAAGHDKIARANELAARRYRSASNDRATASVSLAFDGDDLVDLVDGPRSTTTPTEPAGGPILLADDALQIVRDPDDDKHDDRCESDFITGAMGWSPCDCDTRRSGTSGGTRDLPLTFQPHVCTDHCNPPSEHYVPDGGTLRETPSPRAPHGRRA